VLRILIVYSALRRSLVSPGSLLPVWLLLVAFWPSFGMGADDGPTLVDGRRDLLAGRYHEVVAQARDVLAEHAHHPDWTLMLIEGLLATGQYPEALAVTREALAAERRNLPLRWAAREVFLRNGQPEQGAQMVKEITELFAARPLAFRDPEELVAFGRAALVAGADPRRVMERIFDALRQGGAVLREAFVAAGELALEKHDFALAAKTFQDGLKKFPDDPDLHYGLARAYASSEATLAQAALEAALKANTAHLPSLLLLADSAIDAEDDAGAETWLDRAAAVNPWHPDVWSYRAVLARLRHEPEREKAALAAATKFWPADPQVPHLVGRKLSQDYRFAEGATFQREALRHDPSYLPAKAQLAHALLRLGEDAVGWRLAEEVHQRDGYDVAALNLVTLRDTMSRYATLTNTHFIVRMAAREAALYGARVLEVLERARAALEPKYGFTSGRPVRVEIFAEQKDFAVRTFGMPENHGFLGVCFGPVITANSPASRPGQPFNWESMLWHEFCHVVTLGLTRNKMPRWLSEGISVYEERQADPAWGERMVPRYREMILGDDLTPVGELSGAFLAPRSDAHLQFAYYQCSLVVEFIVERFGMAKLTAMLRDLGEGTAINQAIARHTLPLAEIEPQFEQYARDRARQWAPSVRWGKPLGDTLLAQGGDAAWAGWAKVNPDNFYVLTRQAGTLVDEERWAEAKPVLQRLVEAFPGVDGLGDAYAMLARVHRELGETEEERRVLARLAQRDDKAVAAYERLMVNPLVPLPYRLLAPAGPRTGHAPVAIQARRALLELDPPNPAEVHYHLARLLHGQGEAAARRHVLRALEDAPRYRAALQLLLEMP